MPGSLWGRIEPLISQADGRGFETRRPLSGPRSVSHFLAANGCNSLARREQPWSRSHPLARAGPRVVVASWSHPLRVIQGPKRRGSKRLPRVLVPAVAGSNPVAHPHEFGSRPGDPDHTLAHDVRARGTSLPSKCLFSQPRRGAQKPVPEQPAGHESPTSRARAWGGVDAARWLDTERPLAPIRVRLADWFERALRRERRYRPLACEAIAPMQRKMPICRLEGRRSASPSVLLDPAVCG